jgi:hypothetical protein
MAPGPGGGDHFPVLVNADDFSVGRFKIRRLVARTAADVQNAARCRQPLYQKMHFLPVHRKNIVIVRAYAFVEAHVFLPCEQLVFFGNENTYMLLGRKTRRCPTMSRRNARTSGGSNSIILFQTGLKSRQNLPRKIFPCKIIY